MSRPPRNGDFYIDNLTRDFWLRENNAWVLKGSILPDVDGGSLISIQPILAEGFVLGAQVDRTRFLGSIADSLGISVAAVVTRFNMLAASVDNLGFAVACTVSVTNIGNVSAAMALGFGQAVTVDQHRFVATVVAASGYSQASALTLTGGIQLTVVGDVSGGLSLFSGAAQNTKYTTTANPPASGTLLVAWAGDKSKFAVVSQQATTNAVSIYDTSNPPVLLATITTPQPAQSIAFSTGGRYIVVGMNASPWFAVYDGNNAWAKLNNPATLPTATCDAVAINHQDTRIVVSNTLTPLVYAISGTTLTYSSALAAQPNTVGAMNFSADGTALVAGIRDLSVGFGSWTVGGSGTTFTANALPSTGQGFACRDIAISPDNSLVVTVGPGTPSLAIYSYPGMVKQANPAVAPSNFADGVGFSPSGSEILLAGQFSPNIEGYTVATMAHFSRALGIAATGWKIRSV